MRPYAETNNLTYNQQISNASQPQQSYGTSQGYSQPGISQAYNVQPVSVTGTSQAYNYQPGTSGSYNLPASGTSQGYYTTSGPTQTVITTPPIASSTVQPVSINTSQHRGSLGLLWEEANDWLLKLKYKKLYFISMINFLKSCNCSAKDLYRCIDIHGLYWH